MGIRLAEEIKRLKSREVADYRQQLLLKQHNLCALCGDPIEPGKAVLDHDHETGHIRGVLHRGCNALEGKIVNNMARNHVTPQRLHNMMKYWDLYHGQHQPELHPTHRTPEEQKARAKKRAQARRKK